MAHDSDRAFLFEELFRAPVLARFDGELGTSDAGLTLLAAVDRPAFRSSRIGAP